MATHHGAAQHWVCEAPEARNKIALQDTRNAELRTLAPCHLCFFVRIFFFFFFFFFFLSFFHPFSCYLSLHVMGHTRSQIDAGDGRGINAVVLYEILDNMDMP